MNWTNHKPTRERYRGWIDEHIRIADNLMEWVLNQPDGPVSWEMVQYEPIPDMDDTVDETFPEIWTWYACSEPLTRTLFKKGYPVIIEPGLGYWWGRSSFGGALEDERILQEIFEEWVLGGDDQV